MPKVGFLRKVASATLTLVHHDNQYVAILRCQTWNVWPEHKRIEYRSFSIDYGAGSSLPSTISVISYARRTDPGQYLKEKTKFGPLVGELFVHGSYVVRDSVLLSRGEEAKIEYLPRNAYRGEVDICIDFQFAGELSSSLLDALAATAHAIMTLLNVQLRDSLTPTAPLHLRRLLPTGGGETPSTLKADVRPPRELLRPDAVAQAISTIGNVLLNPTHARKLRIALELYAAHLAEQQVRVRFLLLVIAIEVLAKPTKKHRIAVDMLDRWRQELANEMGKFDALSEEFQHLESLSRELDFRGHVSIRSQVRKLFAGVPSKSAEDAANLERKAMRVYDKRSALVHDGYLPAEELTALEVDARELLERVFTTWIAQSAATTPRALSAVEILQ